MDKLTYRNDYEFINASFKEKVVSKNELELTFEIKEFEDMERISKSEQERIRGKIFPFQKY